MVQYLSATWIEELQRAAQASPSVAEAAAGVRLVVQQHVTGAPDGEIDYYVSIADGTVDVRPGLAGTAHIAFSQDYATACQVAAGELDALDAFQDGRLHVRGDVGRLSEAQPALEALDEAFAAVRSRTTY